MQNCNVCNFCEGAGSIFLIGVSMKCQDLLKQLGEYVDGTIDPELCREFEQHLAGCTTCEVVIDNLKKTITIFKAGQPYELPLPFRSKLHEAIRARWKETHRNK